MQTAVPSELKVGQVAVLDGTQHMVESVSVTGTGQSRHRVHARLHNLQTGRVGGEMFLDGEHVALAELEHKKAAYSYRDGDQFVCMDLESYAELRLSKELIGEQHGFLKENAAYTGTFLEGHQRRENKHMHQSSGNRVTSVIMTAAVVASFGLRAARGADWPRWRGANADGISSEAKWNPQAVDNPTVKWKAKVGLGHSCMTVSGKNLYTMGNVETEDIVQCLNALTGKEIWKHSYACSPGNYDGPRATPVLDGNTLYTVSRNGQVFCLDAQTGEVKWEQDLIANYGTKNIRWGLAGSPVVEGDALLFDAGLHGIALNKKTGKNLWVSPEGHASYATPVVYEHGGKKCVALFSAGAAYGVDVETGKQLWSHPWKTDWDVNAADPIYYDGKIFITSGYDHGCALLDISAPDLTVLWENKNMRCHFSSPILIDGHIYGVDDNTGNGGLTCINALTGEQKWRQAGGYENLMVADNKIIAIDKQGDLTIAEVNPAEFKQIARGHVLDDEKTKNWTAPVLANGLIYCRNSKGTLVCIDVSK